MPLVYISRGTGGGNATTASVPNFTAAAGARLFCWGLNGRNDSTTPGIPSMSGGGLTWNSLATFADTSGSYRQRAGLWYADVGGSPLSVTPLMDGQSGADCPALCGVEYAGHKLTAPVAVTDEDAAGGPVPTFGQPAAGSHVLCFVGTFVSAASAFNHDAAASELFDTTLGSGSALIRIAAQVRESGSYTSLGWSSANTASPCWAAAIEIEALPDLILPQFDRRRQMRNAVLIGAC